MVTFADHPKSVLIGRAPATVTSLEHRLLLFRRAGIDAT
jgi:FAD synthase